MHVRYPATKALLASVDGSGPGSASGGASGSGGAGVGQCSEGVAAHLRWLEAQSQREGQYAGVSYHDQLFAGAKVRVASRKRKVWGLCKELLRQGFAC